MTRSALLLKSKQRPGEWLRADDVVAVERGVYRPSEIALHHGHVGTDPHQKSREVDAAVATTDDLARIGRPR